MSESRVPPHESPGHAEEREARAHLDRALARRASSAEQLRLTMLAVLFAGLAVLALLGPVLIPGVMTELFHDRLDAGPVLVGALLAVGYALASVVWVRRRVADGRRTPSWLTWSQAAVEAAVPTAALFLAGHLVDPAHGLTAPPLLLYFLILALSALRLDPALTLFTGAVSIVGYVAVVAWALPRSLTPLEPMLTAPIQHFAKCVLFALITIATALIAQAIRRGTEESVVSILERDRVAEVFGRHVSPEVAEHLLAAAPGQEAEERYVAILFVDIRDFTTLSERRAPSEVMGLLDAFFAPLTDAVEEAGGFVNKFLGDGFLAVFGAPIARGDPRREAVAAAREMLARVARFNAERGGAPVRVGIGIHAGTATTGSVGSSRRREYTVIGDVVNVAARIEGLNKQLGTTALISADVRDGLDEALDDLGDVQVKGRSGAVRVYRLA